MRLVFCRCSVKLGRFLVGKGVLHGSLLCHEMSRWPWLTALLCSFSVQLFCLFRMLVAIHMVQ